MVIDAVDAELLVAFDVHNTLTRTDVQALFSQLKNGGGCTVVVWSSMGSQYAREFCEAHNLEADAYLDKNSQAVHIAIDDVPASVQTAGLVLGIQDV